MLDISLGITDFIAIPIVGVILSFGLEWLKEKFHLSSGDSKAVALVASVLLGAAYWFLRDTNAWVSIVGILGAATVFWAFFIKGNSQNS